MPGSPFASAAEAALKKGNVYAWLHLKLKNRVIEMGGCADKCCQDKECAKWYMLITIGKGNVDWNLEKYYGNPF